MGIWNPVPDVTESNVTWSLGIGTNGIGQADWSR
jgi:hypothetical protein